MTTLLTLIALFAPPPDQPFSVTARQAIVVTTPDWDAMSGTAQRFERSDGAWKRIGEPQAVVIGKNGLAWGRGLSPLVKGGRPPKVEGDGRAPAGVFRLTQAYGKAEQAPKGTTLPYAPTHQGLFCIDDPTHPRYNRIVDAKTRTQPWKSAEKMRRRDPLYDRLIVVEHNDGGAPLPGAGSCIFLHVWRSPKKGTLGCTAAPAETIDAWLAWLRADAEPVLIQLPAAVYAEKKTAWGLP